MPLFIAGFEGIKMMIFGGGSMMIFLNVCQKITKPAARLPGGAVRLVRRSCAARMAKDEPYVLRQEPCGL